VDEVEQVRKALHLEAGNFYLLGHSWGGILALEYALKYQQNLKGLIISNMVPSIPAYNRYAHQVLMPAMDQQALAQIKRLEAARKFDDPQYEALLMQHFYVQHLLRMPPEQWPDPVQRSFGKINKKIYVPLQGPSEMGASGLLVNWDRSADLPRITVPTLAIGARYDTMEPAQMQNIARKVKRGRYLFCPNGSHLALYDDQQVYMHGLIQFLQDVDAGRF
jgi:proline iminopeptidase